jgi:hypothetical protein
MADRPALPLRLRSDDELGSALRAMAVEIDWPSAVPVDGGPDVASAVRARLEAAGAGARAGRAPAGRAWSRWTWRPARRALVVALVILLALAALVGAAGLGLPGLRIIFGGPGASPTPSAVPSGAPGASGASVAASGRPIPSPVPSATPVAGPPGSGLGLGRPVDPGMVDQLAGFAVLRPSDPSVGPPDAAWVDTARNDEVSLVWAASDHLPRTTAPGIGLVEMAFRGSVSDGWYKKIVGAGTTVEPVLVNGHRGYWVSGDPHQFFYEGPNGIVEETRRWVGDALMWADGPITYRLETSIGRDATVALAETMR